MYAFRDRRQKKKRNFRKLWITRIKTQPARMNGLLTAALMHGL